MDRDDPNNYQSRKPRPKPSRMPRAYQAPQNLNQDLNGDLNDDSDNNAKIDDDFNDEFTNRANSSRNLPGATNFSRSRKPARPQSFDLPGGPSKQGGKKAARQNSKTEEDKKEGRKKLLTLLSNQTVCLVIIFALIGAYNWMSADYSGEYISQDKKLGLVKLSLVRRATTVDGELYYTDTPSLEMQQGKPPKDGQVDLLFINQNQWAVRPNSIVRARFIGTIDGSIAEGAVVDFHGTHDVRLTKNIVASLYRQLQAHIPNWHIPSPPPLFRVPKDNYYPAVGQSSVRGFNSSGNTVGRQDANFSTGAVNLERRPLNSSSGGTAQNNPAPAPEEPKPFSFTSPFKQFQSK